MNTAATRLRTLRQALSGLADLLVPLRCAGCGTAGTGWCAPCAKELGGLRRLHRPLLEAGPPLFALGRYRGAARMAVLAYKESGRRQLADPFGRLLASGLQSLARDHGHDTEQRWWLVPAPSRSLASRRRGGAHMVRVARRTASSLVEKGWSASVADCLSMGRGVRDSTGLDPAQRLHNLSGRLSVRRDRLPPTGAPVVLIDDVVTTGATVATCLRALKSVGIRPVAVLSLIATAY